MTVLMTADTVALWTEALDLAKALGHHGVLVLLATSGPTPTRTQRREAAAISTLQLVHGDHGHASIDASRADVTGAENWLAELEQRHRTDLVHVNGGFTLGAVPFRGAVLVTVRTCPTAPDAIATLADVTRVVVPSHAVAACVRERVAHRYPIDVVWSGRDATRFATGPKREVILAAGHFRDEGENVAPLVSAAQRVPWPILVDGYSDSRSLGLDGLRRFERLTSRRAARLYSRASIFVAVARQEAVGLSPLEAAFSGCALVLGDMPSLRELWDDAATFVDPENPDALVEALTTLIENRTLRQNLARRALERAQQYDVDSAARGYLSLYRELTMPLATAAAAS